MHLRRGRLFAMLLCGWLFMIPPMKGGNVNLVAPVIEWDQFQAFDSARACEEGRAQRVRSAAAEESKVRSSNPHDSNEVYQSEAQHDRARAGRCVRGIARTSWSR